MRNLMMSLGFGSLIALAGCSGPAQVDVGEGAQEQAELSNCGEGFNGAIAYAYRYSDERPVGVGDARSGCDDGELQQAAFSAGKRACGGSGAGQAYASVSRYRDGRRVLDQRYDCGDL